MTPHLKAMSLHYNATLKDLDKAQRIIKRVKEQELQYIKDWMYHCKP